MQTAYARRSQISQQKTFVEKLKNGDGATLCLVKTRDLEQRPCWFLLKTSERQIIRLKCTLYEEILDLNRFGEIIDSGWG